MTTPNDSASQTTNNDSVGEKKAASAVPVVPNTPKEPGLGAVAETAPKPAIDSALVGTPQGTAREAAEKKTVTKNTETNIPATGKPVTETAKSVASMTQDAKAGATKGDAQVAESPKSAAAQPATAKTAADLSQPEARKSDPLPAAIAPETGKAETRPEQPKPEQPKVIETRVVEVRKAGFVPTLLGGVIAAGLGAGAAYYAIPHLPAAWQPVAPVTHDPQAQILAAREAAGDAARAEVDASRSALIGAATEAATRAGGDAGTEAAKAVLNAAMSAAPQPAAEPAVDLAPLERAIQSQAQRLEGLDQAVAALNTPGQPSASTAGVAGAAIGDVQAVQSALAQLRGQVGQLEAQVTALEARPVSGATSEDVAALRQQAAEVQERLAAAASEAEQRLAAAQTEAATVQQQTAEIGRRAQIAAAAAGLQAALETGGNLQGGIEDLRAAGIDLPAALTADIPSLTQLQAEFDPAARAALTAALKAQSRGGDTFEAIGNFLRVQTGARSVEPKDGTDPDAILSRAAALVRNGDIQAALGEIAALPQPGQDAMAGWTVRATGWAAARGAVADLASSVK